MIPPLEHDNAHARFDHESKIAYITYHGYLTPEASTAVYDWLADLIETVGVDHIYGEVFDFRQVTEFMPDNLMEARKNSRRYNLKHDIRKLPVSMIVKDFYQEEILRGPMNNVKENRRKRIVTTIDEAMAFLHEWHQQVSEHDE